MQLNIIYKNRMEIRKLSNYFIDTMYFKRCLEIKYYYKLIKFCELNTTEIKTFIKIGGFGNIC